MSQLHLVLHLGPSQGQDADYNLQKTYCTQTRSEQQQVKKELNMWFYGAFQWQY